MRSDKTLESDVASSTRESGSGAGCLGKDIRAFQSRSSELGVGSALAFLSEVDAINDRRRAKVVDLVRDALDGAPAERRVTVLGASFKPDSDDVRDSPALGGRDRTA